VPRHVAGVTLDNLEQLPMCCRRCVYWEVAPHVRKQVEELGDQVWAGQDDDFLGVAFPDDLDDRVDGVLGYHPAAGLTAAPLEQLDAAVGGGLAMRHRLTVELGWINVGIVQRRGRQHLARRDRPQRGLDPVRCVLDREHDVEMRGIVERGVEVDDLLRVDVGERLFDQENDLVHAATSSVEHHLPPSWQVRRLQSSIPAIDRVALRRAPIAAHRRGVLPAGPNHPNIRTIP
jgi:hypothetical protein